MEVLPVWSGHSCPLAFDLDFDFDRTIPKPCHSDRSRTLSEAEGDGAVEEPASRRHHHCPGPPLGTGY